VTSAGSLGFTKAVTVWRHKMRKAGRVLIAIVMLLAGCGGAPAATAHGVPKQMHAGRQQGTLTKQEAARVYLRLVGPVNAIADALNLDTRKAAPFSQYLSDTRRLISVLTTFNGELNSYRWPTGVQRYITSLVTTENAAAIACAQAQLSATGYNLVEVIDVTNRQCQAYRNLAPTVQDKIRAALGLSAVTPAG
jgi:hypothetical protein